MWLRTPFSGRRATVAAGVLGASIGTTMVIGCSESPTRPRTERGTGSPALTLSRTAVDISVSPTGDQTGNADADAIEHALAVASPGNIIELAAGRFYVS